MTDGMQARRYWVDTLIRIIDPVLTNSARGTLKKTMPKYDDKIWNGMNKDHYGYLEAVGRVICGASGWLSRPARDPEEEEKRAKYANLARKAIDAITDPLSPDRVEFFVPELPERGQQCLVDTAFMCHGLIRAKEELFDKLPPRVKANLIACLKESRKIIPVYNNWLLFSGMVEAALCVFGEEADLMRVDYCLCQHDQWYAGDGLYCDGVEFHADYYNSFVILPMYIDISRVFATRLPQIVLRERKFNRLEIAIRNGTRLAAILERLIAPDGTYPLVGRSITYRIGAFQMLGQAAVQDILPARVSKPQVRRALTAVMKRCFTDASFNKDGWLLRGVAGDQPDLAETYICSGSLYLCTTGFLPLALPDDDPFWSSPDEPYTSEKLWAGINLPADHCL